MKIHIPARFMAAQWDYPTWDAAYNLIVRAGKGDSTAKKLLDDLKLGATSGNVHAVRVKTSFDAVAQLVLKGLPKPSEFVHSRRRKSPLLPAGAQTAAQIAAKQQQDKIRRTVMQQKQQLERQRAAAQAKQIAQAKARSAAEARINVRRTEREKYEAELDLVHKQLEDRDIADDKRRALEALAEQYEAIIEKMQIPEAANEPATAVTPEGSEALADDAAEAYPSGAPGDVEFNDGGQG